MEITQTIVHYFLHLIAPLFIAKFFFSAHWRNVYILLLLTMAVDLDHLFATPIFDPERCSINFHPLHTYYAMGVYALMLIPKGKIRIVAIGLLFHMLTDFQDCFLWKLF